MRHRISLTLIVLLGFVLRFYSLESAPLSLNWDEVSHGYNAYSILTTAQDEWGTTMPSIFRAFGDYKLPTYIYLTTLPVAIFGLTPFAVRFISAFAGALAVWGIYLLTHQLFRKHKQSEMLATLSSFIMAILPWHFFLSRPALEATLALTLVIFGLYFVLRSRYHSMSLYPGIVLLGFSLHTYNTERVYVPLLLILFLIFYRTQYKLRQILIAIGIFLVFLIPVMLQVINGSGQARYNKLQILNPQAIYQIGQDRQASKLPSPVNRLIHNRPLYFLRVVGQHYLGHFTPQFFYQQKSAQTQFAVPGSNLLTSVGMILFYFGLAVFIYRSRYRSYGFTLGLLLLAPIASSLTVDLPQAIRPNVMIPSIVIIISYLLVMIYNRKRVVFALFITLYLVSSLVYIRSYFTDYISAFASSYQFGYKEAIEYVQNRPETIIFTKRYGEPHIFWAFYTRLNPTIMQSPETTIRFNKSDWFWTDKIGNIYFVNDWQIPTQDVTTLPLESGGMIDTQNSLLVTSPDHVPANLSVEKIISTPDGLPVFIIGTIR